MENQDLSNMPSEYDFDPDPVDIELARKLAEKRGLKYQTYLKMLIHEALTSEAQAS